MRIARLALAIIGIIQIGNGAVLLIDPDLLHGILGVDTSLPFWTDYIFLTAGARFIGYGIGMLAARRDPIRHRLWVITMIGIQAVDLFATVASMVNGSLPARHVVLTAAPPVLWVALLSWVAWRCVETGPGRTPRPAPAPGRNTS